MQHPYLDSHPDYENIEFTLANSASDYDLDSQQATFLAVFKQSGQPRTPTYVQIRTDVTISVKLNSTSGHSITITSADSPFEIKGVKIDNLFLSNSSGGGAAVKLLFFVAPF